MVRLKVKTFFLNRLVLGAFQFQYGTIKSPFNALNISVKSQFQFQYGTIKSLVILKKRNGWSFISIPVWYD